MKSNVTLKSNVYINKSARSDDIEFLQHIRDYRILKQKQEGFYGLMASKANWMTSVQKEILRQGQPNCSYEQGTMSWGVPVGGDHMRCRCEQTDCHHFKSCSRLPCFDRVQRAELETFEPTSDTETHILPPWNSQAENTASDTKPHPELEPVVETEPALVPEPIFVPEPTPILEPIPTLEPVPAAQETAAGESAEIQVVEQAAIIHAAISDRLWVNAGPGTGKTYTVIQRLKHLLESDIEGSILVLCFSKNAVQVIRDRLIAEIGSDAASYIEENTLVIRTFDSFATYMLEDELNTYWDYDRRIEEFIQMLHRNSGVLNKMIHYLIVDEIQDTVGVRARMLLALLDELRCGVLLLGDYCQAIYDWVIRETQDMTFSALASELTKRHFKRFELEGNRRQSKELAKKCHELRQCMLHSDEHEQEIAIDEFKQWINSHWRSCDMKALPREVIGSNDLILCKTNGEAAYISQRLFDSPMPIPHVMKQSSRHQALAPWIAKLLSGCDGQYLSKAIFFNNGSDYEIPEVDSKWAALKSLDKHPRSSVLHVREVLDSLVKLDSVPECCLNSHSDCTIISTVHRAKGSEANRVFWLDTPLVYDGQREAEGAVRDALNAAYVAVTRARSGIHMLKWDKSSYLRQINNQRWIRVGLSKSNNQYCRGIAFLPEDTNPSSFATEEIQTVLSCLEQGMSVKLYPNVSEKCFDIFFDGQRIGSTSQQFTAALFAGFDTNS